MQYKMISAKVSIHRVSKQATLPNFQKIFLFSKMAAIWNFQMFAKKFKIACIS